MKKRDFILIVLFLVISLTGCSSGRKGKLLYKCTITEDNMSVEIRYYEKGQEIDTEFKEKDEEDAKEKVEELKKEYEDDKNKALEEDRVTPDTEITYKNNIVYKNESIDLPSYNQQIFETSVMYNENIGYVCERY